MARRKTGAKRAKKVAYELIPRDSVHGYPMYDLLDQLIEKHHEELRHAKITLAWCTSWNPDADGRQILGKCQKASDLHRELAPYDFVILLRKAFWLDDRVSDAQRAALLDHELCHATVKYDTNGEPVEDERGRIVYRIKKHDIEEFTDIVRRHGCYKADLEQFAAALRASAQQPWTPCEKCVESPGFIAVLYDEGTPRMARCSCYTTWLQQREEAMAS